MNIKLRKTIWLMSISVMLILCIAHNVQAVPPAAPTGVTSDAPCTCSSSNGRIILYWTDNSTNEESFTVQWEATPGSGFSSSDNVSTTTEGSTGTQYSYDTGCSLTECQIYTFRVKAVDSSVGHESQWATAGGIRTCDVTDPPAVSSWGGQAPSTWTSDNTVTVTWTEPTDACSGLDGYDYSWSSSGPANPGTSKNLENGTTSRTSSPLSCGTNHYLNIRTVDNAGNWDDTYVSRGPFWVDPDNPPAATTSDEGAYSTDTSLTFTSSPTDPCSGVDNVYMQIDDDSNFGSPNYAGWVGSDGDHTWTAPAGCTTWYARVYVRDNAGRTGSYGTASNGITVDETNPNAPTGATDAAGAPNGSWGTVSDCNFTSFNGASDGCSGIDGYYYYWGTSSSGTSANWVDGTTGGYNPGAIPSGSTYYLRAQKR